MNLEPRARQRVIDASGPRVTVEVEVAAAAELLMSVAAVLGENGADTFDLGAERIESIRATAPREALQVFEEMPVAATFMALLLGLVYETESPRTVERFLAHLEATDPFELQLHLLGYYTRGHHIAAPETIRRAALGEPAARTELVSAVGEWAEKGNALAWLLEHDPAAVKAQLLAGLRPWDEHVFQPTAHEVLPLIEQDAEAKRRLAASVDAGEFVERATHGMLYTPRPDIYKLVFYPSYWFRPWVLQQEHKNVRIFCYPADTDQPADRTTDIAAIARVYKALGDERRLALLARLQSGPVTLSDASREIELSKSTTHHHLAILRHAGLVLISDDDDHTYSLRPDAVARIGRLLEKLTP
jgi:DNA-binding transcriptional ArsR family regulator